MADIKIADLQKHVLVIEYLMANSFAQWLLQGADPLGAARKRRVALAEGLGGRSVPGLSPVVSDHAMGEIQEGVDDLMAYVEVMVVEALRHRGVSGKR